MRLLSACAVAAIPCALGAALVTNFRGLAASFTERGGNEVDPVIKVTGWFFLLLPLYPVTYELVALF